MRTYCLLMVLAIASLLGADKARLGTYYNTNPGTTGISKVRITQDAQTGQQYLYIWASCHPRDCYWGRYKINEYKGYDYLERRRRLPDGATWFGSYESVSIDQGFVERKIWLAKNLRHDDHIRITLESNFKDPSREDYTKRYILKLR